MFIEGITSSVHVARLDFSQSALSVRLMTTRNKMEYFVKRQTTSELKYEHENAIYIIFKSRTPKHIVGKWGSLKVSGTNDNYKIDSINLFTITGQDKLISINDKSKQLIKAEATKVRIDTAC